MPAKASRLKNYIKEAWRNKALTTLIILLLFLPITYLEFSTQNSNASLRQSAKELSVISSSMRDYYTQNIIKRIQDADGKATPSSDYLNVHGGIPIPATFSIELGSIFNASGTNNKVQYRFISDYPFKPRRNKGLDTFETESINLFRRDPLARENEMIQRGNINGPLFRYATPVIMKKSCVTCHNSHPSSRKTDWKEGDIRGIQEIIIRGNNIASITSLSGYTFATYLGVIGVLSIIITKNSFDESSFNFAQYKKALNNLIEERKTSTTYLDQLQHSKIFENAIENAEMGVVICDANQPDHPTIYVNKKFTEITGYSPEFAIGKNCRYLQGPETDVNEVTKIGKALRDGITYSGIITNYRIDGTKFKNYLAITPIYEEKSKKPTFFMSYQIEVSDFLEPVPSNQDFII